VGIEMFGMGLRKAQWRVLRTGRALLAAFASAAVGVLVAPAAHAAAVPAGARVAATRPPDGPASAFLAGVGGPVLVGCSQSRRPFPLTGAGFAPPGAPVTATLVSGGTVKVSVPSYQTEHAGFEVSHPC
jgi:hypothetical protein